MDFRTRTEIVAALLVSTARVVEHVREDTLRLSLPLIDVPADTQFVAPSLSQYARLAAFMSDPAKHPDSQVPKRLFEAAKAALGILFQFDQTSVASERNNTLPCPDVPDCWSVSEDHG